MLGSSLIKPKKKVFLSKKEKRVIIKKRTNETNKKNFLLNLLLNSFFFNGQHTKVIKQINIKINKKYLVRLKNIIEHGNSK